MSKDYTRNQHFVPRAYLRFFSYKKKNEYYVKVFDKKINKSFESNINNIASFNNFYEVYDHYKNHWENYYSHIESILPIIFNNLIISSNLLPNESKIINEDIKNNLCAIIHMQLLRTRNARLYFDELGKNVTNNMIDKTEEVLNRLLTEEHLITLNKYRNNLDFIRSVELDKFNEDKFIKKCQIYLKNKVWIVYKNLNSKEHPFVTCDNPIIYYNYITGRTGFGHNGIARSETIIMYPLNRELLLVLYPEHLLFGGIKKLSNELVFLNDIPFVIRINKLHYLQSYRQVYYI